VKSVSSLLVKWAVAIRLGLWALAAVFAFGIWRWCDAKLIATISMALSQTCLLAVGGVWALRQRADDTLADDSADASAFEHSQRVIAYVTNRRVLPRAIWTALMVPVAGIPVATLFTHQTVWEASTYAAAFALSECAYSFLLTAAWGAEMRSAKTARVARRLREREQAETLKTLYPVPDVPRPARSWRDEPISGDLRHGT
jgi:hypothetical protein